jgi:heterotetrameric sarcosine oxidase gamma subunit
VTPSFLSPGDAVGVAARSPVEREARAAGARFEERNGWNVAVDYGAAEDERATVERAVGWADMCHLGKLQVQGPELAAIVAAAGEGAELQPGSATRAAGAWWCPVTPERALVLCEAGRTAALRAALEEAVGDRFATVLDLTTAWGALAIAGPQARETFARFCAIDLRPASTPVAGFRPGSVARTPGFVLCEGDDRFLALFGWAVARYLWTVVADAARSLGGAPVGVDALATVEAAHA